ncbi:PD40 domain-containing protein [bacterium]|nr:PD40 domain-containing protein [bacterium]
MTLWLLPGAARGATTEAGGIAFVQRVEEGWQLCVAATPEAPIRLLTTDPDEKRDPAWSPDGTKLAYATHRGEVFVLELESGGRSKVAGAGHGFFAQPVFLPHGRALVMVRYITAPADDSDLWTVELGTGANVTPRLYYAGEGMEHFPAVGAADNALFFSLYDPKRDKPPVIEELIRMDLTTQKSEPLTQLSADSRRPAADPAGGRLAFSTNKGGNFDIWLMDRDRQCVPLVEHPANDDHPSWSPSGEEIVYESTRDGLPQLWIVNVKTRAVRKLTAGDNQEREPAWWSGKAAGDAAP